MHCPVCKCYCHNEELDDCPTCGTAYSPDNTDLQVYDAQYVDLGNITELAKLDANEIARVNAAIRKVHQSHGKLKIALVGADFLVHALLFASENKIKYMLDPFLVNLDKLINLEG